VKRFSTFRWGGEACPKFGAEMRWFPAGNYVIFYRPINDEIHVVRVIDGRGDLDEAFWRDR
jgi:plasmid stabilization system protein ParE